MTVKYNVIGYLVGEGFQNVFKNKKSTAASLIIMCLSMMIFGIFFLIGENVNYIIENIEEAQGIRVFIKSDTTDSQIRELGSKIEALEGVSNVNFLDKEYALNEMKETLKDNPELMEAYEGEDNIFSASYLVNLSDLKLNEDIQTQILSMEHVKRITSSNKTISTLIGVANAIRIVTGVILVVLIIISIFIISNTIKLTVHARRKEISIMKYVGATNSFIRWPFIVEGIIIGVASALITVLILGLTYNAITGSMLQSDLAQTLGLKLVTFKEMFNLIIIVYLGLGIGMGILGSSISMRKYLEV